MKIITPVFLSFALVLTACKDNKTTTKDPAAKTTTDATKRDKAVEIDAPDFADPELKEYYSRYTAYIKKVVTSITNKEEAGAMKLFSEEGKQFGNRNEMDEKARVADEGKYTTWLMQSLPAQRVIVESAYFKKFNEAYYKKVREDFEKKGN